MQKIDQLSSWGVENIKGRSLQYLSLLEKKVTPCLVQISDRIFEHFPNKIEA